jgi:hypothetical protein
MDSERLKKMIMPREIADIFKKSDINIIIPESRSHLLELAMGGKDNLTFDISYNLNDGSVIREASAVKCKNGVAVNYDDIYMRRRDPDSMAVADDLPTDKPTFFERFGEPFDALREETFDWLKDQESLIVMPFYAGASELGVGYPSILIAPGNAGFFALGLADLQGFIPADKIPNYFKPKAAVYVAPPFRHTRFDGKQIVVHNRLYDIHEVFSYNLYPGPSAKKGIYAGLLDMGERERWLTLHASTVKVITPYELSITIMHEGASGGGKSEMTEPLHREPDGRFKIGDNLITGEEYMVPMNDVCEILPVTDDMALCHPAFLSHRGSNTRKLITADAESGWFLRVNHISQYGTEIETERNTIHPVEPLLFFNIEAVPNSTALIWEHAQDAPGVSCPNPRVIMPRSFNKKIVHEAVEVDIRSFGIRTPPTTRENPNYGVVGLFHLLPPALAWIWRLVSPRGFANPSITDPSGAASEIMHSEGVGSYWPFATGRMVDQANLLLEQILKTTSTRYVLIPNQYIGAYKVLFAAQWAAREYLSRRGGAKFRRDAVVESRCPLLGYTFESIKIDGTKIKKGLLQVDHQPEVGREAYDAGARILSDFFKKELEKFLTEDLIPIGREIIEACLKNATPDQYIELTEKFYASSYFFR